jgi:hypothetical protein
LTPLRASSSAGVTHDNSESASTDLPDCTSDNRSWQEVEREKKRNLAHPVFEHRRGRDMTEDTPSTRLATSGNVYRFSPTDYTSWPRDVGSVI